MVTSHGPSDEMINAPSLYRRLYADIGGTESRPTISRLMNIMCMPYRYGRAQTTHLKSAHAGDLSMLWRLLGLANLGLKQRPPVLLFVGSVMQ